MSVAVMERAWASAWSKPDRRPPSQWAHGRVKLPHSARAKEFRRETAPWVAPVIDVIADPLTEFVTVNKSTQGGGTTIYETVVPWAVLESPGDAMLTCQSDDDAKKLWVTRLLRVLKATDGTRQIMEALDRSSIGKGGFVAPHMFFDVQGPALSNLQSKSIRWAINDEAWMYKPGTLQEIIERTTAAWARKIITVSQAGFEGDDLDKLWTEGTQEHWSWTCPKCRTTQPYRISAPEDSEQEKNNCGFLQWDPAAKIEGGGWNIQRVRETAHISCQNPSCSFIIRDDITQRRALSGQGIYVPANPLAPISKRSFRWNRLAVYWTPLADVAEKLIRAKAAAKQGNLVPLRQLVQKDAAEPWKETNVDLGYEITTNAGFSIKDYENGEAWTDEGGNKVEAFRLMTIDVQQDHRWVLILAVAPHGAIRILWAGRLETWDDCAEAQSRYKVPPRNVAVDAKEFRSEVYQQAARYGWVCLQGDARESFPHVVGTGRKKKIIKKLFSARENVQIRLRELGSRKTLSPKPVLVPLFTWSNLRIKDTLDRIKRGLGVPLEIPHDICPEFKKHMDSEAREQQKTADGQGKWIWVKKRANHLWDCACMALVLLVMANVIVDEPAVEDSTPEEDDGERAAA